MLSLIGAILTAVASRRPSKGPQLTEKQKALNATALVQRKKNANKELHDSWAYQFNALQIQAHKALQEARNSDKL